MSAAFKRSVSPLVKALESVFIGEIGVNPSFKSSPDDEDTYIVLAIAELPLSTKRNASIRKA